MTPRPLLFLIDGSSQMYRAFHAPVRTNEGTLLRNAQGIPTNAVYIFVTMLRKLIKEQQPHFIAASFDLPGPTFRDELDAEYKANRRPMPSDLAQQIPLVHRACEALGVPIITEPRYEADDVIGTLTTRAVEAGFDVAIVTGDKDFFQLVHDGVRVFNPRDEGTWFDAAGVKEKFGVRPDQVVDVLALMGDSIDNVKGVPGIGEKGARELIEQYGSLDRLLAEAATVPQKRYREALLNNVEAAHASRTLLRIHTDVPVPFAPDALRYRGPSSDACYTLFGELGFRSLVMEYAPTANSVTRDYALVRDAGALRDEVAAIRRAGHVSIHVVADDPDHARGSVVGVALSTEARRARYVPVRHRGMHGGEQLTEREALDILRPVLEDVSIAKVGHDLKTVHVAMARSGVVVRGLSRDTLLASYLIDATRSTHAMADLAIEHLGYRTVAESELLGKGAKAIAIADLPPEAVLDFAGELADVPLQLADRLWPQLSALQLSSVYDQIELPLLPILASIERIGVKVDTSALHSLSQRVERDLAGLAERVFASAGEAFNINSPQQLAHVLFEKLQLPTLKRNAKTRAPSTAVEVLEELSHTHEMPRLILEWRGLQKLKGTYIDALPALVHADTGRVHTRLNQAVAATGRLSSSDPNLQNIPIKTELGREIRRAFVAEAGHTLISADYSQIEFRVLAHLSEDPVLVSAFREGADFHERTAIKIFGSESGRDPKSLRAIAKMVNYALLYGKTAFTLAKDIGVTPQAAQEFIDAYFSGFPRVRAYIDHTLATARSTGMVRTLYGRRRVVPDVASPNTQIRQAAEREAVNMPIQGTAADIMKLAMIRVDAALEAVPGARTILSVHDELLLEVVDDRLEDAMAVVRTAMESAAALSVPLSVDIGSGRNWDAAKP